MSSGLLESTSDGDGALAAAGACAGKPTGGGVDSQDPGGDGAGATPAGAAPRRRRRWRYYLVLARRVLIARAIFVLVGTAAHGMLNV